MHAPRQQQLRFSLPRPAAGGLRLQSAVLPFCGRGGPSDPSLSSPLS